MQKVNEKYKNKVYIKNMYISYRKPSAAVKAFSNCHKLMAL